MRWSAQDDADAQEMATNGWSAAQIGDKIGKTRNSVLGRLFRLKIGLTPKITWQPEKTRLLEKLYIAAYPLHQIAEKLGMTEKAVQRKLDRVRAAKAVAPRKRGQQPRRAPASVPRPRVIRLPVAAQPINVPFMAIERDQCRYIPGEVSGADTIYCGAPIEAGQAYCSPHCRVCFQPRA
jgi:GcrA cell cycle regulator